MHSLQGEIGRWGEKTFGAGKSGPILAHLKKEVVELIESEEPEEAADVLILLFQHAYSTGYDLMYEARKKMAINYKRKWGPPDAEGVIEHIKEGEEEE